MPYLYFCEFGVFQIGNILHSHSTDRCPLESSTLHLFQAGAPFSNKDRNSLSASVSTPFAHTVKTHLVHDFEIYTLKTKVRVHGRISTKNTKK